MWSYQKNYNQPTMTTDSKRQDESVLKRTSYFDAYSGKNSPSNRKVVIEPRDSQERQVRSNGLYSTGKQISSSQPVLNESGHSGYFKGTYPYRSSKTSTDNNASETTGTKKKGFFQEIRKKFNSQRGSPPKVNKSATSSSNEVRRPSVQTYFWDQNQQQTEKLKSLPRQINSQAVSTFSTLPANQKPQTHVMTIGTYAERQQYKQNDKENVVGRGLQNNASSNASNQYQSRPNFVRPTPSFRHIGVQTESTPSNTQTNTWNIVDNGVISTNRSTEPQRKTVIEMTTNFMTSNQSDIPEKVSTNNPNKVNGIYSHRNSRDSHSKKDPRNSYVKDTAPIYMKSQARKSWHPSSESNYAHNANESDQIKPSMNQNEYAYIHRNHDAHESSNFKQKQRHQELTYSAIDDEFGSKRNQPNHSGQKKPIPDASLNNHSPVRQVIGTHETSLKPVQSNGTRELPEISFKAELESTLRRKHSTSKISRDFEISQSFGKRNQIPSYQSYQEAGTEFGDGPWQSMNDVIYKEYSSKPVSHNLDNLRPPTKPNEDYRRPASISNTVPVPPPPPKGFQPPKELNKNKFSTTRSIKGIAKSSGNMDQQRSMLMEEIRNARSDKSFYVVGDDSEDENVKHITKVPHEQSIPNKNPHNLEESAPSSGKKLTPHPDYD